MAKKKLLRYEQFGSLSNSFEVPDYLHPAMYNHLGAEITWKGRWAHYFGNDHPITLELGCGRAEYTMALAAQYPARNFIGIDLKGNRMYVGAKEAAERGMQNVAFVRMPIEAITHIFAPQEVQEIWITFADPQPGKPRKRLTSPLFLARYRAVLAPDHYIHLKTDSDILYESTLEVIAAEKGKIYYQNADIYSAPLAYAELEHKTHYEGIHSALGKTIKYVRFGI